MIRSHLTPRAWRALAGTGLAVAVALVIAGCDTQAQEQTQPPPPDVGVAAVLSEQVQDWNDATGRIAAIESVELRPRVSGYVQRVAYAEGDEVKQGDLLFVIDPRPYRAALQRAEAELARARADAQLATTRHARAQSLIDASAISRDDFEARSAGRAEAEAAVRGAQAAVETARLDLAFTEVRAPVAGRAGRAMLTTGNLAQADASMLTTVVSQDPVHVYFETDERTYLRHQAMSRAGERTNADNAVRVGLADETGYPHAGTVDFLDNQIDPATGTVRARAVLPNPDRRFTPGLFARVQLEGAAARPAILIDDKAVITDQDRKFVYVVGEDNTAQRRDIVPGRVVEGLRVVESGLAAGDRVIVNGVQKVFMPGMPVAPKAVAMRGGAPIEAVAKR
ncbi:efflux RND transporter periplasmic adaptor subunit [Luteimonas fraxinea]|uniref:Efflux RND transporter periplasmic adaptor subunit n=1 Tax=Luteimonas fraxinea TaxID=2901869 RepID=A0ABS8UF57_9GAMM|nr:efflux RND transporter periplasmic adaptor subunit [Luteimonas fraxinea]MCD9097487.1 efflux RND transporter periplasmic adaptor subunit [Luteimonas fraxinea]UHH11739.1 efflux RND transporter periplasmic adaptor subunit [Luteimonas fraxinea]